MKKICLFGDSISKGVIFDAVKNRYVYVKNSFANLISSRNNIEIENFSKFGCTITKGADILEQHMAEAEESIITVLEFGGNDSDYDWRQISNDPLAHHEPKTPVDVFCRCYSSLIEMLKGKNIKTAIINLPPIDEKRYFEWFSKGLNKSNILKWLGGSVEYIYRWHESYNSRICYAANHYNIPLIDIRTPFLEKRNYRKYLGIDGIHPNEQGHALISETIQKYVDKMDSYVKTNDKGSLLAY